MHVPSVQHALIWLRQLVAMQAPHPGLVLPWNEHSLLWRPLELSTKKMHPGAHAAAATIVTPHAKTLRANRRLQVRTRR